MEIFHSRPKARLGRCCLQDSTSTSDDSFASALSYSTNYLEFYQWITRRFEFQIFTYRQVLEELIKENPYQFDISSMDRSMVKSMLKIFVEVKMLKYYKDGYFSIPHPTLSFEITETSGTNSL